MKHGYHRSTQQTLHVLIIIVLVFSAIGIQGPQAVQAANLDFPGPTGSQTFGVGVFYLANGNFIVLDPLYSPGTQVHIGAVYLYDGSTRTLIGQMTGSTDEDRVGSGGVKLLGDGNFVVASPRWSNAGASQAGAVTWCSAVTGCPSSVTAGNSLVGSTAGDLVGTTNITASSIQDYNNITPVSGSAYLVRSPAWSTFKGAVTYCADGSDPDCLGSVSAANSLVGATGRDPSYPTSGHVGDYVGQSVTLVPGQGYIVNSSYWMNGSLLSAGAVVLCPVVDSQGCTGVVSTTNSLYGTSYSDGVGSGITLLVNGDFVVESMSWGGGSSQDGAATYCAGLTDSNCIGKPVTTANSLTASVSNSIVAGSGITALEDGNYIVKTSSFRLDASTRTGAATFCTVSAGTSSCTGQFIAPGNSLIGDANGDGVGSSVVLLDGGAFVVSSSQWHNYQGAATYCASMTACAGQVVSSSNSLTGTVGGGYATGDNVSNSGVKALSDGSYLVSSSGWNGKRGAVTHCPSTGCTGEISSGTSLTGSKADDQVGQYGSFELANGAVVISSPSWANGATPSAGAVTYCATPSACMGDTVEVDNSLVTDQTISGNYFDIIPLTGGAYLVGNYAWANGAAESAGELTWCPATGCQNMTISQANSLVGSHSWDYVSYATDLKDGAYVVQSSGWQNGEILSAGALTICSTATGCSGPITADNSVLGSVQGFDVYGDASYYDSLITYAYDSVNHKLIVGVPTENKIVFYNAVSPATTNPATSISASGATLNGSVNANDIETSVRFEYGLTTAYGSTATATPNPVTGSSDTPVSAAITGLAPSTTYHFRVVATAGSLVINGLDQTFTTDPIAPAATSGSASSITSAGAVLNGSVNAYNASATVTFDYGLTSAYGSTATATQSPVSGTSTTPVSASISGLAFNTTYHFRVTATNAGGTTNGLDQTFTTAPVAPSATTNAASSVTSSGAVLNGSVNPHNASTTVTFDYGLTTAYGSTSPAAQSPVTGTSNSPVSASISGLTPNTTYHFRVAANNAGGTTNGLDQTFTTSAIAPTAATGSASSITSAGAVLNGSVNANNASTTVTFEYGLTSAYGSAATAAQSPVTGTSNTTVSASISGLSPNTTYHFRVAASNVGGTSLGLDQTLTTQKGSAIVSLSNLSQVYDGSQQPITVTTTPADLPVVITYTGTGGTTYPTTETPPIRAGSYTVSASVDGSSDYQGSNSGTLTITPRPLTVSATGVNREYDGTVTAGVTLASNQIPSDEIFVSYENAVFENKNIGTGKTIDVTGISISGEDAANYSQNTTATTSADITGRALTVTATGVNKVFDGTTTATVLLSTDKLSGDTVTASYTSATFASSDVSLGISVSVSGISISGTDAGNYILSNTTATTTADITLETSSISLSASKASSTYLEAVTFTASVTPSGATGPVTYQDGGSNISGCVDLELSGGSVECTIDSLAVSVTPHSITAVYAGDANYAGSVSATLEHTVNKAATTLEIDAPSGPIFYGETLQIIIRVESGSLEPDGGVILTVDGGPAQTASLTAGQAAFSLEGLTASTHTLQAAYNGSDNFLVSSNSHSQAIQKADAVVSLAGLANTYTGTSHPTVVTTQPEGLDVTVTYAGSPTAPTTAGTYPVVATIVDPNYTGAQTGSLVITPARLKVTAADKTRRTGEANPTFTYNLTGFVHGETLPTSGVSGSPSLSSTAGVGSPVGQYPISTGVGNLAAQNYSFQFVKGILTVHTPPSLNTAIPNLTAVPGQHFMFSLASDTFTDADPGDVLSYSARLADGRPLPAWLSFSPTTRTFSGVTATSSVFSIRVQVVDRYNDTATDDFDLTVATPPVQNHAPQAFDDVLTTRSDTPASINLLANDRDPDGDLLSLTSLSTPVHGSFQIGAGGQVTYTPDLLFSGVETVVYMVGDTHAGASQAALTITTSLAPPSTQGVEDGASTLQNTPVDIPVIQNDLLGAGPNLFTPTIQQPPSFGSALVNLDQTVTYNPGPGFTGLDTFTYLLSGSADAGLMAALGLADSSTDKEVTVTVVVGVVPDEAAAGGDLAVTQENLPVDVDVLVNDSVSSGTATLLGIQSAPEHGQVTVNPDKTLRYTPDKYYNGTDQFSYSMGNGGMGYDTAQVSLTIQPVNQAPYAVGDTVEGLHATPLTIEVLANDSDVEDNGFWITSVTQGIHGRVEITDGNDQVVYTPVSGFTGEDHFLYTITDQDGGINFGRVTVQIEYAPGQMHSTFLPSVYNQNNELFYFEDFSATAGNEWSAKQLSISPNGEKFLGVFSNDNVQLSLDGLPGHSRIKVEIDLYIIRSWDGNGPMNGPDIWRMEADGTTLLETTFSNNGARQAFPGNYPGGNNPSQAGAQQINSLGYYHGITPMDATYHLVYTFDHEADLLEMTFAGLRLQPKPDETWGLDNLSISVE